MPAGATPSPWNSCFTKRFFFSIWVQKERKKEKIAISLQNVVDSVDLNMTYIWPAKSKKRTFRYAPSEDSDQTAPSCSLIRIFPGRILIAKDALCMRTTKTPISMYGWSGWFESVLDEHIRRYVFSRYGTCIFMSTFWNHFMATWHICF